MDVAAYSKLAAEACGFAYPGAFYGPANALSLGAGLIYDGVRFPLPDLTTNKYKTVEGLVVVLTHECDVDSTNQRHFNDMVIVCPIIPMEELVRAYEAKLGKDDFKNLLLTIAANKNFRVFFLPPGCSDRLQFGGFLYLNRLCSTPAGWFKLAGVRLLCALSTYGMRWFDLKLENHLRRPKAELLPLLTGPH